MQAVPASVRQSPPMSGRGLAGNPALRRSSPLLRLSPGDFDLVNAARRILEGSLSLVPGEMALIIVDRARADLVPPLVEVAKLVGAKSEVVVLEDVGFRPMRELPKHVDALLSQAQATVLLAGFVDGEHPMRLQLLERVRELGLRHAHMVGVTRRAMLAGFSVDPTRILDATRAVRMRLRPASVLHARTSSGTDLHVKLAPGHRWAEHVGVIRPGRWENLPSGELMTAPQHVHGVFVCDASSGGSFGASAGLLTRTPVRLEIEDSVVKSFTCSDPNMHRGIESFLAQDRFCSHVGTIILGTNVGLLAPIGELVCDQNLPGLHITLGSTFPESTGASPTTSAQLSLTSSGGDVDLDGAPLLRNGRYMV
jgi:leucyl aminopeptidase (aminopeptidase T)